jgi:PAS domain S-box-containing protein
MKPLLRILHLEDDCTDADLVRETLAAGGIASDATRVDTQEGFIAAIENGSFDLIFADYTLPSFDGMSALAIVQQRLPKVPFIFVTGTLGEETAIEALKLGATDYVFKTRLSRLVPSVKRALREAEERNELKRSEDALRASEEQLRTIIDCLEGFIWSADSSGSVDFFNQRWFDYTGLRPEEVMGSGWIQALHPEDASALAPYWASLLRSGQPGEFEARFRRIDGVFRWFLIRAVPIRDGDGQIAKWYGLNTDIDDRKRSEDALKRSECFLAETRRLSLTGGIWRNAVTGESIWSEEVYSIYEIDPSEPSKVEVLLNKLHPEDRSRVKDAMDRSHTLAADFELPHRVVMSDGRIKYIDLVAHFTRNGEGNLEYIAAIQDVTERELAEQALNSLRSELAYASRVTSLGALTASIAHEVNQPLSGIITNASTCLRMLAASPPNIDGALETARRTIRDGNRASDVIKRLRAMFSKQDAITESLDLNEATREVIALALSELQKGSVILRQELAKDLPPIKGDRVQLQQVILNLLLNSADAMKAVTDRPKLLVIRTERAPEDHVRLTVQDTGVGVEPHRVDKLFEAFYTTKPDGMGIGLSVSRSIIERHNGRLWAQPNDGPGATFAFSIPLTLESMPVDAIRNFSNTNAVRARGSL